MSKPKKVKPVVRVLKSALTKIQAGWTQGASIRKIEGARHYCAMGAIDAATRSMDFNDRAETFLQLAAGITSVVTWNDKAGRKKSEVVSAFKKAIKLAEKEHV